MSEVININDRRAPKPPEVVSTYSVEVNLDPNGDVVSGSVKDWGALASPEMRTVADHLERLAFLLRLDAEQALIREDKDRVATVHIFRSSRVCVWTHGDVETKEQAAWIRDCLESAKALVEPSQSDTGRG